MKCDQSRTSLIPTEQKFNFRGLWNPCNGEPLMPSKYDAYIVNQCVEEYETGDWIVRDKDNTRFLHVSVGIISSIVSQLDFVSKEEYSIMVNSILANIKGFRAVSSENKKSICDIEDGIKAMSDDFECVEEKFDEKINELVRYVTQLEQRIEDLEDKKE